MGSSSSSKELLQLEHKNVSTTPFDTLLLSKKDSQSATKLPPPRNPISASVSQSQVLGKVKDFLGVISEANKRLQQDAKDNSQNHDIEVLTGNESQVIEMDLMLGIADLHTPEAMAAAESAIAGNQQVIPLDGSSSETESEDTTDCEENDDGDDDDSCEEDEIPNENAHSSPKHRKHNSKKRPRIVEMS